MCGTNGISLAQTTREIFRMTWCASEVAGDPVQSSIASFGSENEKNIVDPARETALIWKNHPAYKQRDVVKVDLQGDIALGTALQQFSMTYSTRR